MKMKYILRTILLIAILSLNSCNYVKKFQEERKIQKYRTEFHEIQDTLQQSKDTETIARMEQKKDDIIVSLAHIQMNTKNIEIAQEAGALIREISGFRLNPAQQEFLDKKREEYFD